MRLASTSTIVFVLGCSLCAGHGKVTSEDAVAHEEQAAVDGAAGREGLAGELLALAEGPQSEAEHTEGEHAKGEQAKHEPGEHRKSFEMLMTTSYLLIGFLVANFGMLKLVNWDDANIRSFTWKMISGTVSIYLAVITNSFISQFTVYAVTQRFELSEEFDRTEFILQVVLFNVLFALGTFLCWAVSLSADALESVSVIGGHITAFAGLGVVEAILKLKPNIIQTCAVSGALILSLAILRMIWHFMRNASRRKSHEQQVEQWILKVVEMEDDATSIVASFIVMKVVMVYLFPPSTGLIDDEKHSLRHIRTLLFAFVGSIVALVGTTYWRKLVEAKKKQEQEHEHSTHHLSAQVRAMNSVQITIAMTMSWLALHLATWSVNYVCPTVEERLTEIITAALITVFSIVGILIIDKFADNVPTRNPPHASNNSRDLQTNGTNKNKVVVVGAELPRAAEARDRASSLLSAFEDAEALAQQVVGEALNLRNLEQALRKLIDALSLAVGLSWEHAFHAALHTVVDSNDFLARHQVWSDFTIMMTSLIIMLPVWLGIIAKMANLPLKHFEDQIASAKVFEKNMNAQLKEQYKKGGYMLVELRDHE